MGYIQIDKTQLTNLEYSLGKEIICSNEAGSYFSTTILGCNTRKYHGLLIVPQHEPDGDNNLLLSKADETIIDQDGEFNLGINRFPGKYSPQGHLYVNDFSFDSIPVVTYQTGGVVLTRETMFALRQERVMIRYTLVKAGSPVQIRIRPFPAFRKIHQLSKRNTDADTGYVNVQNGIRLRMYSGYPDLFMQFSRQNVVFKHQPDWYDNFEYPEDKERGYDYQEDLFTPGFFEIMVKKGESFVFSASTAEIYTPHLARLFNQELEKRKPWDSYENCLANSAKHFFIATPEKSGVLAGFPWFDQLTRFTFISLPGLMKAAEDHSLCEQVIDTLVSKMDGPLFPELQSGKQVTYDSADTPLWFFQTLQRCFPDKPALYLWDKYGAVMTNILNDYLSEQIRGVNYHENGLLFVNKNYPWLTWMNATVDDLAVTPRYGYVVELNALWYNAVCYTIELAGKSGHEDKVAGLTTLAEIIRKSFADVFWINDRKYLADWVFEGKQYTSVRPNQMMAISLPYSVLDETYSRQVLDVVIAELLTPRGIRSLSPSDENYTGRYEGNPAKRSKALHQGTVWPWLLGPFADAFTKLHGNHNPGFIREIYENFQNEMAQNGIGTISELFDGDPPHSAKGAPSFAPSVAEIYRLLTISASTEANNQNVPSRLKAGAKKTRAKRKNKQQTGK